MRSTILLLSLLAACGTTSTTVEPFQDRLLATLPEGVEVRVPPVFSRDGRVAAYVAQTQDGCRAVRGDWKSRRLDSI